MEVITPKRVIGLKNDPTKFLIGLEILPHQITLLLESAPSKRGRQNQQ